MFKELSISYHRRFHELVFGGATLVMLVLIVPTLLGYFIDDKLFHGISTWVKPLKFEISLALYFGSLYWFSYYIDDKYLGFNAWKGTVWTAAFIAVLEILYIFSHAVGEAIINIPIPISEEVHILLGVGAILMTSISLVAGYFILRSQDASISSPLRLSFGLGLLATGILGGITGIYISVVTTPWIGHVLNDAQGIPFFAWSRTGGDPRVSHMMGLHAMQGIPFIAYFAEKMGINSSKFVWGIVTVWTLITIVLFIQAVMDIPFITY